MKKYFWVILLSVFVLGGINADALNFNAASLKDNRMYESLDRGLVVMKTADGIYLSWRLDKSEDDVYGKAENNVSFAVYRNGVKITEVDNTTNYIDKTADISDFKSYEYSVAPIIGGIEMEQCTAVTAFSSGDNYFDIPLEKPDDITLDDGITYSYIIGDCSCGDIDGDGKYELIVLWDANRKDNSSSGYTGNVLLDAYEIDDKGGKKLWRIDLGKNIRAGSHYTQFLVYDFDLDGKAELMLKTAPGSKDGLGNYITDASDISDIKNTDNTAIYVDNGGRILDGDEFLTVFDGETGSALDTIYYPVQRISAEIWGDTYGNRVDRFLANVAWLDGEKPYAIYMRGYYFGDTSERSGICAIRLDENKKLICDYCFDTYNPDVYTDKINSASYNSNGYYKGVLGYTDGNEKYVGQGNHNCTVADVDGDGKDEFITGALCMEINENNEFTPRWCTFLGHGDALHIGDYDPTHNGYEFFTVHEEGNHANPFTQTKTDFGMSVIDADTGEILKHVPAGGDTGRGMMANLGMGGYYQFYAAGLSTPYAAAGNNIFGRLTDFNITSYAFRVFWDGDLYDELLDSGSAYGNPKITDYDETSGTLKASKIRSAAVINGTKSTPALQADLFGDWREELLFPVYDSSIDTYHTDYTVMRVFVSNIYTDYKIASLMQDSVYRSGVAAEQTAYNQPPHIGFYLDTEAFNGKFKELSVSTDKTEYKVGEAFDISSLKVNAVYEDVTIALDSEDYSVSGYDAYSAGSQTIAVSKVIDGIKRTAEFCVSVDSPFGCDENGIVNKFTGDAEKVILPNSIDNICITGMDINLTNSGIKEIYIYQKELSFSDNTVFNDDTVIYSYENSSAYRYALEHSLKWKSVYYSYFLSQNFEGEEYSGFSCLQKTSREDAMMTIGDITYCGGGCGKGSDGYTGFYSVDTANNRYLKAIAGRRANADRYAFFDLNTPLDVTKVNNFVLSMDLYFETDNDVGYIAIGNDTQTLTSVYPDEYCINRGQWYKYKIVYDGETIREYVYNSDECVYSKEIESNITSVSRIWFPRSDSGASVTSNKVTYIDNLEIYSLFKYEKTQLTVLNDLILSAYMTTTDDKIVFTIQTNKDADINVYAFSHDESGNVIKTLKSKANKINGVYISEFPNQDFDNIVLWNEDMMPLTEKINIR